MPTINNLNGQPVSWFTRPQDAASPVSTTVGLYLDYDAVYEDGVTFESLWQLFEQHVDLESITQLIIGRWDEVMDTGVAGVVSLLRRSAPRLRQLEALFIGDLDSEESEISWIQSGEVGELLNTFPNLTYFGVRGGNDLRFRACGGHDRLQTLVVETGGLDEHTVQDIIDMSLPELTTLELWLGDSYYGFTGDIDTYLPLIIGKPYPDQSYPFPKLERLALKNSEIADDLARAFLDAPVLAQLTSLDLSMGTMSDQGAQALVDNEAIAQLETLDLKNNYIQDASLFARLQSKGVRVDHASQKRDEDGYDRYVDVGE